jgi:hypothetical protein
MIARKKRTRRVPWWHIFHRVPVPGRKPPRHWVNFWAGWKGSEVDIPTPPRKKSVRDQRIEKMGLCSVCHRIANDPESGLCYECSIRKDKKEILAQPEREVCSSCWENKVRKGMKTCDECRGKASDRRLRN